ncbi:MAG: DNA polymerase/3'-5' exonuclease PolX [Planctomycetes bacterium]|nr:DNA polymerase/3'-5' exonuclease PolX [Planctomycetota bacterium]
MATTNAQLAALFARMADVMQIIGVDGFRVNAYRKVSRVLEDLSEDIAKIGPDMKRLTEIDGIGKGSAERIIEFLKTGRMKDHDDLVSQIPPGLPALLDISGLGPKTAALLWKEGGIESVEQLKEKLKDDSLAALPGLGEKKLESLRKSLTFTQSTGGRVRIGQAMPVARWFVEKLRTIPGHKVKEVAFAGSLRRGRETIGDIDLLVAAPEADGGAISDYFVKLEPVGQVIVKGPTKTSVRTKSASGDEAEGMQVDVRIVPLECYGAALMYFTGSKEHNVSLRQRAIDRGLKLSEWGLFKGEQRIAGRTEEEVYRALGLDFIPPELREDRDEIAQAERHTLPDLLNIEDIHAELHAHTTASDGRWSIRELAEAAVARGFHTLAVTDHSKSQPIANGLTVERLEQHIKDVHEVAASMKGKIRILAGSEVDILADGTLDYPNSVLRELDLVVASPHAALSQDPEKATKRLLRAINNPSVTIIGHATGRLINRREGLHPEMKALFAAAAERGIAFEINANSYRLDLRDAHARAALEAGVKLAINTDAHGPPDLNELIYGVMTARRAGATKHNVINCLSRDALTKWIASTRA